MTKNTGKAIRTRLLNLSRKEGVDYMKVLVRYLHERLLFRNRNTTYNESLMLFTEKFSSDPTRNILWKSFLKKIRWKEPIPFPVVMQCIKDNLQEYWNEDL